MEEADEQSSAQEIDKFASLVEQFRNLPDQTRQLFILRETIRLAAKVGDELSQGCFSEDPSQMLSNLRDAFFFRMSWPERPKSTSSSNSSVSQAGKLVA